MPNFVEYLRAARALRIAGIFLGVCLALGLAFRLYFLNGTAPDAYATSFERSPTAHVTRTTLRDGGVRTVVDDPPRHVHAVIVRHAGSFVMNLAQPAGTEARGRSGGVIMGNTSRYTRTEDGVAYTTVTYQSGSDMLWGVLFLVSAGMGLLIATILGGPLAKENDGHLELAWTKPVSRELYALAGFGADAVAIVASQLLTIVTILIATAVWAIPHVRFEDEAAGRIAVALLAPLAWYAFLTTISASLKRGPGTAIGVAWVIAIIVPAIGSAVATHAAGEPVLEALHAVLATLTYLDPIAYIWFQGNEDLVRFAGTASSGAVWVAGLAVAYAVLAIAQWRRVEA
jgi:ABC-type transport system involved in multi-copper enzyme maturation permease subunit